MFSVCLHYLADPAQRITEEPGGGRMGILGQDGEELRWEGDWFEKKPQYK